ncbi:MAG: acyl-CoA dehydrogenase [Alphaproteobacteria bacterium]|jgi:alkylation response protein AidB-like acyl-CoA dehydrogenase|nr:acyl-CoA dehydrogenase [Alphaproteobacteria bacterium]
MTDYRAPIDEIRFALEEIAELGTLSQLPAFEAAEPELVAQALGEAGRLAAESWAPLNRLGDETGCRLENGVVRSPDGFAEAYRAYCEGGWNGVSFDPEYGGMGLPWLVSSASAEIWNSANMNLALCPLLTQGAVEAIHAHGSEEQKALYLPKLVSGTWSGTMNLTEPQAGSDVGALRAKAEPAADGSWRITGQKIFITYGEHELVENIVHLVLARTPDSPPGTRGISLFIVPKYLPTEDGAPGERNDLRCVSLEEKLGIHASPTCVMSYGDDGGAVGFMLGEENRGMAAMFTMMNNARLTVGIQGVALAERAYQQAAAFALERRQSRALGATEPGPSPIVQHADVRRMLMTMKAKTEAVRAICYVNSAAIDLANGQAGTEAGERAARRVEVLTPIAKAFSTDVGCEVASIGVQVHGGMGFIEETGAAQYLRDVRITPIYEGTNGIQAMDLVLRKLSLAGGEPVVELLQEMAAVGAEAAAGDDALGPAATNLAAALAALGAATDWLAEQLGSDPNAAAAGCSPYLEMWGLTLGGQLLIRGALRAHHLIRTGAGERQAFLEDRIAVARFFAEQILPRAPALLPAVTGGTDLLYALPEERLVG